ncbi:MAG: hypoxanthine phosphoribosyltransferase [Oscillospiraceae bacterium]|nr:hypoxanthine phosphoribosyltransferase [Oscillospiraceae bacterium]MDY4586468.1 hypoxanthine phosphoribosyltransferase [Oscillospiraceae bacterium]
MREDIKEILFTQEDLKAITKELGEKVTRDYKDKKLYLVTILKGAVVFLTDFMRNVDLPCEVDFMVVSSYGSGVTSSGNVKIIKDLDVPLEDKDILIVEDILDSGNTLKFVVDMIKKRHPKSVEICALLDKPSRRIADIQAKYVGREIPDEFVVGYGLDYDEKYRNLPYLGVLKPEVYTK